jgi:hypothetical protein
MQALCFQHLIMQAAMETRVTACFEAEFMTLATSWAKTQPAADTTHLSSGTLC